ncbi:hypothetical protein CHH53_07720 [Terribacillus sp. 7520-G]|nr:hypothetical protein CHH53_07720 [Terribacillus sp. 7520-G]
MTLYALAGFFDASTEKSITALWEELLEKDITDYAFRRKGHRPHLTFASFHEADNQLIYGMEQITKQYDPLPLSFQLFGSFMGKDAFLLLPNPSASLMQLQRKISALHMPAPLYTPDNWIPHITLANYLSQTQYAAVQQLAKDRLHPFTATMIRLALIQVTENEVAEWTTYPFKKQ